MTRDTAAIWAAAEAQPAPAQAFVTCEVCAQRRPAAEVAPSLAKFRGTGDFGMRELRRCKDTVRCRDALEAFGEEWPLDDALYRPLRKPAATEPSSKDLRPVTKPAVEVAPDPPAPGVAEKPRERGPEEPVQAPAADDEGWF